jgi:hypothetical protein
MKTPFKLLSIFIISLLICYGLGQLFGLDRVGALALGVGNGLGNVFLSVFLKRRIF